ncbi:MAG: type II secretion system major pseudopilin GspG [Rhodobacteraceae bacterium]|nr:type II secretion system major pseudopilin GspG [Paracoccaceae bacterium]
MKKKNAGVTLLEVMVVLAIMALVIGIAGPRVIGYFGKGKAQAAQIQIENLNSSLKLLYLDIGRYPLETEGLELLLVPVGEMPEWRGPYLDRNDGIIDPWGRRYIYTYPGAERPFDLKSLGEDGQVGGDGNNSDITL